MFNLRMWRHGIQSAILILLTSLPGVCADLALVPGVTLRFATVEEGVRMAGERDDFVRRLSPFDRAARLKTDRVVNEAEYLKFVKGQVVGWGESEKRKITLAFDVLRPRLTPLSLPWPREIWLIRTTGMEEGQQPYTRGEAIFIPARTAGAGAPELQRVLCHELFHILSRAQTALRNELYASIGFRPCEPLQLPPDMERRRLTNPDAPRSEHALRIQVNGTPRWAIPVIYSRSEKYDVQKGGEFFAYLESNLFVVDLKDQDPPKPEYDVNKPVLIPYGQAGDFFEQVGRNTQYIIHPEEILADNFVALVMKREDLPSPEVVVRMAGILRKHAVDGK